MKSIEEAKRLIEEGTAVYRRAKRQSEESTSRWNDYTESTRKRKTQTLIREIDSAMKGDSFIALRNIDEIHKVQEDMRTAIRRYLHKEDTEGCAFVEQRINIFNNFLLSIHLPAPLPHSRSASAQAWKKVKERVREEDNERERISLIRDFGLDERLTLKRARTAARRILEKRNREEQQKIAEKEAQSKRERLGLNAEADVELASALIDRALYEINKVPPQGYLYLRCWVMPDGTRWYKIGITNNLKRRESEQNVLPVSMETLAYTSFESYEHARVAEQSFHEILEDRRIRGAQNKELFHLEPNQVAAVITAIENVGKN